MKYEKMPSGIKAEKNRFPGILVNTRTVLPFKPNQVFNWQRNNKRGYLKVIQPDKPLEFRELDWDPKKKKVVGKKGKTGATFTWLLIVMNESAPSPAEYYGQYYKTPGKPENLTLIFKGKKGISVHLASYLFGKISRKLSEQELNYLLEKHKSKVAEIEKERKVKYHSFDRMGFVEQRYFEDLEYLGKKYYPFLFDLIEEFSNHCVAMGYEIMPLPGYLHFGDVPDNYSFYKVWTEPESGRISCAEIEEAFAGYMTYQDLGDRCFVPGGVARIIKGEGLEGFARKFENGVKPDRYKLCSKQGDMNYSLGRYRDAVLCWYTVTEIAVNRIIEPSKQREFDADDTMERSWSGLDVKYEVLIRHYSDLTVKARLEAIQGEVNEFNNMVEGIIYGGRIISRKDAIQFKDTCKKVIKLIKEREEIN